MVIEADVKVTGSVILRIGLFAALAISGFATLVYMPYLIMTMFMGIMIGTDSFLLPLFVVLFISGCTLFAHDRRFKMRVLPILIVELALILYFQMRKDSVAGNYRLLLSSSNFEVWSLLSGFAFGMIVTTGWNLLLRSVLQFLPSPTASVGDLLYRQGRYALIGDLLVALMSGAVVVIILSQWLNSVIAFPLGLEVITGYLACAQLPRDAKASSYKHEAP
ncbi:MAG: hypothetical protein U0528_07760 [Anaerolineae bacterium]